MIDVKCNLIVLTSFFFFELPVFSQALLDTLVVKRIVTSIDNIFTSCIFDWRLNFQSHFSGELCVWECGLLSSLSCGLCCGR